MIKIWPLVPPDQRRQVLANHWICCDGNLWRYRRAVVAMSRDAGYLGESECPQEPVRLYRGCYAPREAQGVSWTADLKVARWFGSGGRFGKLGGWVYTVVAPVDAILGRFTEREEDEYVVDPSLLPRPRKVEIIREGQHVEPYHKGYNPLGIQP